MVDKHKTWQEIHLALNELISQADLIEEWDIDGAEDTATEIRELVQRVRSAAHDYIRPDIIVEDSK